MKFLEPRRWISQIKGAQPKLAETNKFCSYFQPTSSSSHLLDRCQNQKNPKQPLFTIPENWDSIDVNTGKTFPVEKLPDSQNSENSDDDDSEEDSEDSVSSCSHSDSDTGSECSGSGSSSSCSSDDDSSSSSYCSDQVRARF